MKSLITAMIVGMIPLVLLAQDGEVQSFEVKISTDTILLGNFMEVRFVAQNLEGTFEPPKFTDFDVVGGPNQSTSMSIVNGHTSQTASFSYFIKPRNTGLLHIEPAYYLNGSESNHETQPHEVTSLPNPNGVVQESRIEEGNQQLNFDAFPFFKEAPAAPKRKLKVTKI
ncbi:MAG: BatD family protein [Saprospiraceae bacterium]|nr:BatD family protein [Saprospiraceae bacterium]